MKGNGENAQVELLMERLQGRDNADAYAALKELLALSEATDAVSAHFDTFARLLHAKSAFARTRGFLLIVANARWDAEERTTGIFDDLARLFNDPKPTTARQCVQAAPASPRHSPRSCRASPRRSRESIPAAIPIARPRSSPPTSPRPSRPCAHSAQPPPDAQTLGLFMVEFIRTEAGPAR